MAVELSLHFTSFRYPPPTTIDNTLSPELSVDFSFENEKLTLDSIKAEILAEILRYNPGFDIPEELLLPNKHQQIVSDNQSTMMYDGEMGLSGFDSSMSVPMLRTSETNGANSDYDAYHISSSGTNTAFRNTVVDKPYFLGRWQSANGVQIENDKDKCAVFSTDKYSEEMNSDVIDFTDLSTLSKPPLVPRSLSYLKNNGISLQISSFPHLKLCFSY